MTGDQRRRADKIMRLLLQSSPPDDVVVLANVFSAFMLASMRGQSVESTCEGVDALAGDVKDSLRLIMAEPSGALQ